MKLFICYLKDHKMDFIWSQITLAKNNLIKSKKLKSSNSYKYIEFFNSKYLRLITGESGEIMHDFLYNFSKTEMFHRLMLDSLKKQLADDGVKFDQITYFVRLMDEINKISNFNLLIENNVSSREYLMEKHKFPIPYYLFFCFLDVIFKSLNIDFLVHHAITSDLHLSLGPDENIEGILKSKSGNTDINLYAGVPIDGQTYIKLISLVPEDKLCINIIDHFQFLRKNETKLQRLLIAYRSKVRFLNPTDKEIDATLNAIKSVEDTIMKASKEANEYIVYRKNLPYIDIWKNYRNTASIINSITIDLKTHHIYRDSDSNRKKGY